jgi:hypothetical protein
LKDLPQLSKEDGTDKYLRRNTRYLRICEKLKSKEIMAQIQFLISVSLIFEKFLTLFQKQEPQIHMLHSESRDLVKTLKLRFMNQGAVGVNGFKLAKIDPRDSKYLLNLKEMEIGSYTQKNLSKIDTGKQNNLQYNMRKLFQEATC